MLLKLILKNNPLFIFSVSIMLLRPQTSKNKNYKILNNQTETLLLKNNTVPPNQQTYSLIKVQGQTIRQYLLYCQNIELFLALAEWRYNASSNIVKSKFAKVSEQTPDVKDGWVQYYTEHIELLLRDMNKLITAEALYCLIRVLKGYRQLLKKFKKASVNAQTIGLNSQGQCIVWINRHLQRNYPQYSAQYDEQVIIKTVVNLLKQKGQKACQNIMEKIQLYAISKKTTIPELIIYVQNLINIRKIVLPKNLKYLLRQKRIVQELSSLDGQKSSRLKNTKHSTQYTYDFTSSQLFAKRSETSYMTCSTPADRTFRRNEMKRSSNVFHDKQYQKLDMKMYSTSEEKYKMKYRSRKGSYNYESNLSHKASRGSVQECINIINSKSHKTFNSSKSVQKYPSTEIHPFKVGKISQAQTSSSMSDVKDSILLRVPRVNEDPRNLRTHNTIASYISKKSSDEVVPEEDKESEYESSSPDKCSELSGYFGFKDSGRIRQKLSDEFKQKVTNDNAWIKNIDDLCSVKVLMNASIVQGPEKYAYLDDIRLDGLDKLNTHMTKSEINSCQRIQL